MDIILKNKVLSVIGSVLAVIHAYFVGFVLVAFPSSGQSAIVLLAILWGLDWFVAPLSMFLLSITQQNMAAYMLTLIVIHGILGTIGWFFTPILIKLAIKKFISWLQIRKNQTH